MSDLELNTENNRVVKTGAIQYASKQMNDVNVKDTMEGIKRIAYVDRNIREAILAKEAEKDKIVDSNLGKNPIVTGAEIAQDVQEGTYREMLDR